MKIARHVWAQWRFENDFPDYQGPQILSVPVYSEKESVSVEPGPVEILVLSGGGKDSLVAMKLLERAGLSFASHSYACTAYGDLLQQHSLSERLLAFTTASRCHRLSIFDDFFEQPSAELCQKYGVRSFVTAETPSSIFAVLPIVLSYGYHNIVVGHERSADAGNLLWTKTKEVVNHQWGKSLAAERLLKGYLQQELISNVSYFSILKPIHDVVIFNLLRRDLAAIPQVHSCNIKKPWCCRCAKCAYVWLNFMAYLPHDLVSSLFGENFFDRPELQLFFRQMMGLEDHTPFECIGEIQEVRLAFELCQRRGITGKAMEVFRNEVSPLDAQEVKKKYLTVYEHDSLIPLKIAPALFAEMRKGAKEAHHYIAEVMAMNG